MGRPIPTDVIGSPTRWLVVFDREAASWWTNFIALGRRKHVRTFGYVHDLDAYVFYDVQFGRTTIQLARGDGARALMLEWTRNADVLVMDLLSNKTPYLTVCPLFCTTAVAHLLGIPSALRWRPDALYSALIKHGAKAIHGRTLDTDAAARPDARPADADRSASADHCAAE